MKTSSITLTFLALSVLNEIALYWLEKTAKILNETSESCAENARPALPYRRIEVVSMAYKNYSTAVLPLFIPDSFTGFCFGEVRP